MPSFSDLLLTTNGTGHPALVLRTGMKDGKPHGTTLIGRLFDEGTLCRLGMAIEMKLDVSNIQPSLL
jgi:Asp-tRNA(Asn)/Glu-tRNA(Gln) amidotransferase A subunit family amidase